MRRPARVSPVPKHLLVLMGLLSLAASVSLRPIVLPTPLPWAITVFHTGSHAVRMALPLRMASVSSRRDQLAQLATSPVAPSVIPSRSLFVPQTVLWMATAVSLESTLTVSFSAPALRSLSCDLELVVEATRRLGPFPEGPALFTCFLPFSYVILSMIWWARRPLASLRRQLPIAHLVHHPCSISLSTRLVSLLCYLSFANNNGPPFNVTRLQMKFE